MLIAQFGTFDVENYGDLLFPNLLRSVVNDLGDVKAVSPVGGPAVWRDTDTSISTTEFAKDRQRYSAIVIGGGNIIRAEPSDLASYSAGPSGLAHYSDLWLGAIRCASMEAPIAWNAPGVPERIGTHLHDKVRAVLERSDYVSVRDEASRSFLAEAHPTAKIEVVPDPAWMIEKLWSEQELASIYEGFLLANKISRPSGRTVIFHLNRRYLRADPAAVASHIETISHKLDATPIFLALGPCHGDGATAQSIAGRMKHPPTVVDAPASIKEVTAILANASAYVGSSMHGFIVASAFGVPATCVANYSSAKFKGISQLAGSRTVVVDSWAAATEIVDEFSAQETKSQIADLRQRAQAAVLHHNERLRTILSGTARQSCNDDVCTNDEGMWAERVEALSSLYLDGRMKLQQLSLKRRQERLELEKSRIYLERSIIHLQEEVTKKDASSLAELQAMRASFSWRVTTPLRKFRKVAPRTTKILADLIIMGGRTGLRTLRYANLKRVQLKNAIAPNAGKDNARRLAKYSWTPSTNLASQIVEYKRARRGQPRNKTVVFTAIVNGYDQLFVPDNIDPAVDYVCFSDTPMNGYGLWEIRPIPYYHPDPTRRARYVKTHAPSLLGNYEIAVWIDANILFRGKLQKYISLVKGCAAIGFISHPVRTCVYQEARACIELKKDDPAVINEQIDRYRNEGVPPHQGMFETNFFVCSLQHEKSKSFMRAWWREIDRYSRRDQLSVNYALRTTSTPWTTLLGKGKSCRNSADFQLFPHDVARRLQPPADLLRSQLLASPYGENDSAVDLEDRLRLARGISADIVVCVHNALEDVERCLESVIRWLEPRHRVILVNDKSNEETSQYLRAFASKYAKVVLIENDENLGYTKTANRGLAAGSGDFRVLLNSDTVVAEHWLLKLIDAAFSSEEIGIVGPMSNAASWQSIPSIAGTAGQTAINEIPAGMTVADVDSLCEKWSGKHSIAIVPLVHGFCLGIKRVVLDTIGFFDDVNFERFYGEENDYCFRARKAGFELAIATNTFVYHRKSRSIEEEQRLIWMAKAGQRFRELHGAEQVSLACRQMKDHPALQRIRDNSKSVWRENPTKNLLPQFQLLRRARLAAAKVMPIR